MNAHPLPLPEVETWPDPPRRWSHSSLTTAEACPLRWAFSRAVYSDGSRGFPERPSEAALRGQVVHLAVEKVLGALAGAGCQSVDSAEAAHALLDLGGITAVVQACVEEIVADLPTHDRAARVAPALARTLRQDVPALRDRVGPFVRRAHLRPRPEAAQSPTPARSRGARERLPLGSGSHTEVWVECPDPPMGGRIDILSLGAEAVEIADVKTGRPSAAHADQLVTYGVLWLRDGALNPERRPPTALTVLYPNTTVPVSLPDWEGAAATLADRTRAATTAVAARPVPAAPSPDACRWCAAKPACPAYWTSVQPGTDGERFVDVGLEVDRELGPDLWAVTVEECPARPDLVGPAMLVTRGGNALVSNSHIRILSARLLDADSATPGTVLSTSGSTEVFRVDSLSPSSNSFAP